MSRPVRVVLALVVATFALVGVGSSLSAPQTVSRTQVGPDGLTTAVATPAVFIPHLVTAVAEITTADTAEQAQPAPQAAPALDQWHQIFNDMAAQLPGTYVIRENPQCADNGGCLGSVPHDTDTVMIAPRTPVGILADVMRHESMHIRQTRVYGNASAAYNGLMRFGGWEAVADCGARIIGARWAYYTQRCTAAMNTAAQAILNGVVPT